MFNNPKKVTMSDIAQRLNISKNAVSLALNNRPGVSAKLRQEIIATAKQMNYHSISALNTVQNSCIVALIPEYIRSDTFFYSRIFWAIEKEVSDRDITFVSLSISRDDERALTPPPLPENFSILGILTIGIFDTQYIKMLNALSYPIVAVDISYHQVPMFSVCSSNIDGGYLAAQYLIDKGHREIGFVGSVHTAQSVFERWCGFQQALSVNKLSLNLNQCILGSADSFQLFNSADNILPFFEGIKKLPTAFFCAGDRTAYAMYNILSEKNIRIPQDISIVGFDDLDYSQMTVPPLTTIHVERDDMGTIAVQTLLDACRNSDVIPYSISLPVTLVERASVVSLSDTAL